MSKNARMIEAGLYLLKVQMQSGWAPLDRYDIERVNELVEGITRAAIHRLLANVQDTGGPDIESILIDKGLRYASDKLHATKNFIYDCGLAMEFAAWLEEQE